MIHSTTIRILENDSNRRGDLFGRLMGDLFVAMGYEYPRMNIHKSGREVDLAANHRLETRKAIGECKATGEPIGGADVNKFVGVLDAERQSKQAISGYFISLNGFRETAIEQENLRPKKRVILLDAERVITEMIRGRILVDHNRAVEVAGQLRSGIDQLELDTDIALLAHIKGWIWAVYYTTEKQRTHVAYIHADGTPLSRSIAEEIISSDKFGSQDQSTLICLNPKLGGIDEVQTNAAVNAYAKYLTEECGVIQLDGLPADGEVGTRKMRLENLFVPLHLDIKNAARSDSVIRQPVGIVLKQHQRLAILAPPGGGKSTLLKRLAIAYIDAERRNSAADTLPKKDWFPVFVRCRELRNLARGSFADILDALSNREGIRPFSKTFRTYADQMLVNNKVLLLVDGLDEISDQGDRAAFVSTLRSALQAYPETAFVVTSREAGFRHIAAHLAPICTQVTLSAFDQDDIHRLCIGWHKEVIGDTAKVRMDATALAESIVLNNRIQLLASNPLLLTTLLLVRRWVGSLPTRRAVLYGKAVEVLLMTWNTEGYEPIPQEEALPQLCFVAASMMFEGVQKVSRRKLSMLLADARKSLPSELGYVRETVDEFIRRVEYRSSLLMMSGLDIENGSLDEFFEFRHLTFQEYLTAKAVAEGWHPGRNDDDTLSSVLAPHINDDKWREVIPLAAVLGGKATEPLLRYMTELIESSSIYYDEDGLARRVPEAAYAVLGQCLADEAPAKPEVIKNAIRSLINKGDLLETSEFCDGLLLSKYSRDFLDELDHSVSVECPDLENIIPALAEVVLYQILHDKSQIDDKLTFVTRQLSSHLSLERIKAALGIMRIVFDYHVGQVTIGHANDQAIFKHEHVVSLDCCVPLLVKMLSASTTGEQFSAAWALAWMFECGMYPSISNRSVCENLFRLWHDSPESEIQHRAAWALSCQNLSPRSSEILFDYANETQLAKMAELYDTSFSSTEKLITLIAFWYRRQIWEEDVIASKLAKLDRSSDRIDKQAKALAVLMGISLTEKAVSL